MSKLEAENSEKIAQVRKIASQAKALNSNIPALFDTWLAEHKIEEEQVETPQEPAVSQLETKNMSAIEQERKAASYEYLKANNMDTSENRKLIEAVRFGSNYVEV
ncbi:MAG: hypothetical protein LBD11_03835 [Candidatus Peribacteria bacterium]|nr:hypothetical protein [Candidatus Peribacteria bacterium]